MICNPASATIELRLDAIALQLCIQGSLLNFRWMDLPKRQNVTAPPRVNCCRRD